MVVKSDLASSPIIFTWQRATSLQQDFIVIGQKGNKAAQTATRNVQDALPANLQQGFLGAGQTGNEAH